MLACKMVMWIKVNAISTPNTYIDITSTEQKDWYLLWRFIIEGRTSQAKEFIEQPSYEMK